MIEILKITIPAVLVLITAIVVISRLLRNDAKHRAFENQRQQTKISTPIRLRAYERYMLLLDRTLPSNLVVSVIEPGMTNFELQSKLISTIRQEFGHNASQQIYISNELWLSIRSTQESLIQLINMCASKVAMNEPATGLAQIILEVYAQTKRFPGEIATEMLKKEIRTIF